jgi:hypothetical protein
MEQTPPTLPETGSPKKAADYKQYLFLLAISLLVGAMSFIVFLDSSPASPPLYLISILLAAYALGLFSSIRLLRRAARFSGQLVCVGCSFSHL